MHRNVPCRNCNELLIECACKRNKCIECGTTVGNTTFTVCDSCWDILETKRINKIVPVQEEVKDGSLGIEFTEQAQNAFDHYEYPNLINTLESSAAFWIGWRQAEIFFSTQQTAHLQQKLIVKDNIIGNKNKSISAKADLINERDKTISTLQQQLKEAKELNKTYGFIIEFRLTKYEHNTWQNHWNHKVYKTYKAAQEAIEQMKKAYDFYKNDYEWKIIELYYQSTNS